MCLLVCSCAAGMGSQPDLYVFAATRHCQQSVGRIPWLRAAAGDSCSEWCRRSSRFHHRWWPRPKQLSSCGTGTWAPCVPSLPGISQNCEVCSGLFLRRSPGARILPGHISRHDQRRARGGSLDATGDDASRGAQYTCCRRQKWSWDFSTRAALPLYGDRTTAQRKRARHGDPESDTSAAIVDP